jgi:uncharacterized protein YjbI with pentapeptide repeats
MLIESENFETQKSLPKHWEDAVLRFCEIRGIQFDGGGPSGALLDCTFERCRWYWSLFNNATLVGVKFRGCEFAGVSFAGCRFVECVFEDCKFTVDSFNKPCRFDENSWYRCEFVRTEKPEGGLR